MPNGNIASAHYYASKEIIIWNINFGTIVKTITVSSNINRISLLSNGYLAVYYNNLQILNPNDDSTIKQLYNIHSSDITHIINLSNGNFVTSSSDYTIKIWDIDNYSLIRTLNGYTYNVNAIRVIKNGYLASGSYDKQIKIWNTRYWAITAYN